MHIEFFLEVEKSELAESNCSSYMSNGHPVVSANDRWAELPEKLKDHVVRVEVNSGHVITGLRRRSGLYHLGNAEGVVQFHVAHGKEQDRTMVAVSAPTKEEALALWDKILVGDIVPDDDYEAPQVSIPGVDAERLARLKTQVASYEMAQVSIPGVDADRLARLENQASDMAMTLLESAMNKLNERVMPTS